MNQGLKYLKVCSQKNAVMLADYSKVSIIPFYAFLNQLIDLMRKFTSNPQCPTWGEYITLALSQKQFSNIFASWIKYNSKSLQSKLISTLLASQSVSKLSLFLKLRKLALKTHCSQDSCLDNILLEYQDIIGILHNAYSSPQTRKLLLDGIKSLFISYKMQQAKIYSCVFIQYALSMHETIQQREYGEATVQNQTHHYGTIPHSIFGYSSIISHNSNPRNNQSNPINNSYGAQQRQKHASQDLSNKYISNFQSIIHEQNGLYRKVRSSQVSVQGFRVIDHKFHDDAEQRGSRIKTMVDESNMSKSTNKIKNRRANVNANLNVDANESRNKNTSKTIEQSKNMPSLSKQINKNQINIQDSGIRSKNLPYSHMNARTPQKNAIVNQSRLRRHETRIRDQIIKTQNSKNSESKSLQSLTYTQRFRSPDISLQYTPDSFTKYNQSFHKDSTQNKKQLSSISKSHHNNRESPSAIKLTKVEQNMEDEEEIKPKQGGYVMFKKMVDRNKSFMQKMLRADYQYKQYLQNQKNQLKELAYQQGNVPPKNDESNQEINIIQNSIVRHSKLDRWDSPQLTSQHFSSYKEKRAVAQ